MLLRFVFVHSLVLEYMKGGTELWPITTRGREREREKEREREREGGGDRVGWGVRDTVLHILFLTEKKAGKKKNT